MATLPDLCREHTALPEGAISHLQRLVGTWGMLSDLCFADLLLFVPMSNGGPKTAPGTQPPTDPRGTPTIRPGGPQQGAPSGAKPSGGGHSHPMPPPPVGPGSPGFDPAEEQGPPTSQLKVVAGPSAAGRIEPGSGVAGTGVTTAGDGQDRFLVIGQVRPTTGQTLHRADLVGQPMEGPDRPVVARSWHLGSIVEGEVPIPSRGERGRLVCIPVRWQGQLVAILTRESALSVGRRPGELERVYVEVFDRFARMISLGDFPFPIDDETTTEELPRVGDGVLVLDSTGRVDYSSPNAVNALHRVGMHTGIDGVRLEEAGLEQAAVRLSYATKLPATEEVMRGGDIALVLRCIPLLDHGELTGSVVLLRDVTDLRRRDRLLLSKDAAIREVHHRVKNNLQTISSLLRLQSRRLPEGEARKALQESERRVRSIALVHEILSRDTNDQVDFEEILPSLERMAEDLAPSTQPVKVTHHGDAGSLPAGVATPLAVVLTELLQNAVEHAFPSGMKNGSESLAEVEEPTNPLFVDVTFRRKTHALHLEVRDNGVGLPDGFVIGATNSLGLLIVRDLVESQMAGSINMTSDGGTLITVEVPIDEAAEDPAKLYRP